MTFNTGNPVPSTDARDLYDNATNLDKATNGTDPTWTDRLGVTRKSWAGMEQEFLQFLADSGFEMPPLAYVDGTALQVLRPTQVIQRNDQLYRAQLPATFPVPLSGTWTGDQIKLTPITDASLRQELSNGTSHLVDSHLVGWRQRTVADRLNDTANAKDYGAIADGTLHPLSERYATLADAQAVYPHATALTQSIDWAAAQAALNSGAPRVHFPGGRYTLSDDLYRSSSVMLVGDGTTSLEFAASKRLTIEGSLTALPALGANIAPTSRSVTFASAPALAAGDVFIAYNPTDYSWSPHRSYYRAGEFFRVHSVSGNIASIYGLPADAYAVADMQMHKVNGVQVSLEDITIKADAATVGAPVVIRYGVGVNVNNFRGAGGSSYQIEFDRCYQVDMLGGAALNNSAYVDDEYGVIITNCHRVTIQGGGHAATRHAIAIGGNSNVCAVPNRDILISNMLLTNSASDIGAADIHGNADRITYNNCTISHANMAGRNVTYRGCTIYQRTSPADGSVVFGSEVVGGTYLIDSCTLVTAGNLGAFGAINLTPTQLLKSNWSVVVRGLIVKGGAGGALAKMVAISVANGETLKCNVDIRGLRCELTSAQCVLFIRCEGNTSQTVVSDGHIVDDVFGPSGMYLIQPTGAALTGIPTRQMEQGGEVSVTTSGTSGSVVAAPISFRYPYSKRPSACTGVSGADGATSTLLGGQTPAPGIYTLSATQIRPSALAATSTFTNGATALLHWRAGIKEI